MDREDIQVFGLGQCPVDYIGRIDTYPPPNVKCEFTDLTVEGGGPAATAMVALSRWGISCAMAGVVGDDPFGERAVHSLTREGIDTTGVVVRNGTASQFAFVVAEPATARRTIFWRRPTGSPLLPDELDYDIIRRVQVIHTDGLFIEASLAACETGRAAGAKVVLDAGTLREGMLDLARLSDYCVVSEPFARSLVGDEGPLAACRCLEALGPEVVGVTLGEKGYVAIVDGQVVQRPAYPVEAVDTTGCGDIFHAGITFGIVSGWAAQKGLAYGSWAAAMVARHLGGRAGIPTLEEAMSAEFGGGSWMTGGT